MRKWMCVGFVATLGVAMSVHAADWPQWRGVDRIGVANGAVAGEWPEVGPKELWRATLGVGYSSPAVVGDRLYVTGSKKVGDVLHGFLYALDVAGGKEIWSADYGKEWAANYPEDPLAMLAEYKVEAADALALALEAGRAKAVNLVLLGMLSRHLPFAEEAWKTAIGACVPRKTLPVNLVAFEKGSLTE